MHMIPFPGATSSFFLPLQISSFIFCSLPFSSSLFIHLPISFTIYFSLFQFHSFWFPFTLSLYLFISSSSLTSFFLFLTCCTRQGKTILGEVKILNNVLGTRDPLIFIVDHYPQMFNLGISRSRR